MAKHPKNTSHNLPSKPRTGRKSRPGTPVKKVKRGK